MAKKKKRASADTVGEILHEPREKHDEASAVSSGESTPTAAPKAASKGEAKSPLLRDLILNAEAALGGLSDEPVATAPIEQTPEPEPESPVEAFAHEEPTVEETPIRVNWSEEAQTLDFIELENVPTPEVSAESAPNPFEELARLTETEGAETDVPSEPVAGVVESVPTPTDDWMAEPEAPLENAEPMEQMGLGALEQKIAAAENDADPEPTEFIEEQQLISIIESLLFATDKPVSTATIKQIFKGSNIRTKDIARALDTLASDYASSIRGVVLEEINGGYQLRTKSDNAEYLRRLAKVRPFKLSGPSLEVMAIIAYRQPITKHEIDEIRGVESGHLLRALMERALICFNGKSDLPGKPMTYGSTRKFLETFGLRNLRELPTLTEIDEIMPDGIGEPEEKEKLSDLTERLSSEITSSYSEGEEELDKISEQLKAVDTTSEFFEQEKQRERDKRDRERAQDIREKIVLGDSVEDKDRRWLDRYEAKLLEPASLPANVADTEAKADAESAAKFTGALEALTSESQKAQKTHAEHEENDGRGEDEALLNEAEEPDDLEARQDWDDDAEV